MSNENTINGLRALAQEQFKKIDEAVDLLEHIEAEIARLKPGYRSGTIGKKLVRHTADKLFRFACREEMRHYACLAYVAADLERLADKVDSLKERSSACAKVKFGRLVRCPKAGIFSAALSPSRWPRGISRVSRDTTSCSASAPSRFCGAGFIFATATNNEQQGRRDCVATPPRPGSNVTLTQGCPAARTMRPRYMDAPTHARTCAQKLEPPWTRRTRARRQL